VLSQLCQELEVSDYSDLLAKVRDLKANQNKVKKEKRLLTNMKMLVKDSHELTSIGGSRRIGGGTNPSLGLQNNQTIPKFATID